MFNSIQEVKEFCHRYYQGHPATSALEQMLVDIEDFGATWSLDDFNAEYREQVARHDAEMSLMADMLGYEDG